MEQDTPNTPSTPNSTGLHGLKTVGQVVRERREALGLTLTVVAEAIGATKGYLSMIENHKVVNPPSAFFVEGLERVLHIPKGELMRIANWQATPTEVKQEIQRMADQAEAGRELARLLKSVAPSRKDGTKNLDKVLRNSDVMEKLRQALGQDKRKGEKDDKAMDLDVRVQAGIPLINSVVAGYPKDFTDLGYPARVADDYVSCPDVKDPDAFAAKVVGDSMQPDYREGDVVIFSPAAPIGDGNDCFVRLEPDHETTFKRIYFDGKDKKQIRLQPLNPRFAPRVVEREQVAGLYRAVWRYQRV